jgi:altronate dehydratase small subunit
MPTAFRIQAGDNVATLLDHADPGVVTVRGAGPVADVTATTEIDLGHKIALQPIAKSERVLKYGVVIGVAKQAIAPGEWVHLHNLASQMDERSGTLDLHTGLPEDTRYE